MSWLKNLLGFENSFSKNFAKDIWSDPTRLLTGVDPASTGLWNKVTGSDNESLVNMFGSPGQKYYGQAESEGIDTGAADTFHGVADAVAGIFAANGLAGVAGNMMGGAANAAGGGASLGGATNVIPTSMASGGGLGLTGAGAGSTLGTTMGAGGIPQVIISGAAPAAGGGLGTLGTATAGLGSLAGLGGSEGMGLDTKQPIPDFGLPSMTSTPPPSSMPSVDWGGLLQQGAGLVAGNVDRIQGKQDSEWWKSQLDTLQGMYQPGTPEATLMQREMEAKDAAAGRRSQYGTRATDLAAKLAQQRANIMTSGGYQNMANAYRGRDAQANNGIAAAIGNTAPPKDKGNSGLFGNIGGAIGSIWGPIGGVIGKGLGSLFS